MIRLRVKEIAAEKKMSQGLLGRKANLDKNTVASIFQHPGKEFKSETLNKLANALGVDARELIEYSPDEPGQW